MPVYLTYSSVALFLLEECPPEQGDKQGDRSPVQYSSWRAPPNLLGSFPHRISMGLHIYSMTDSSIYYSFAKLPQNFLNLFRIFRLFHLFPDSMHHSAYRPYGNLQYFRALFVFVTIRNQLDNPA